MSSLIRYHVASGHIDSKMVLATEDALSVYEREGYDFMESDLPLGSHYVDANGDLQQRIKLMETGYKKNAATGEIISLINLPEDLWVTISNGDPIAVSGGSMDVECPSDDEEVTVEPAGKYAGTGWRIVWDSLDNLKERAKAAIDAMAEAARTRVVTPGAGQAMTYIRKAEAARLFLSGAPISEAQMQRLEDEALLKETTVQEAAEAIVATADQWELLDATIDSTRLRAKVSIRECTTGAQMEEVIRQISWPV